MDIAAAAPHTSSLKDLPAPLPPPASGEPAELSAYRKSPGSDDAFLRARRALREAENWSALAALLVLHAAAIKDPAKVGELSFQAYELWNDRVKDRNQAAHALVRALQAQPENVRPFDLLRKLYEQLGAHAELATLLRWRIEHLRRHDRGAVPGALVELALLYEQQFCDIHEATALLRKALELSPADRNASEQLIRLHLSAGAWRKATDLMNAELARLDPQKDKARFAELHLRLARIEAQQVERIPAAALHLQAALKAGPDNIAALRAFGVLYLSSGKTSDDGLAKAADVFFRAAKLARAQNDERQALGLLRRTLALKPDHFEAGNSLAELLAAKERWMELDELYAAWLGYVSDADSYGLWLQRGELLESHLARREEARACFAAASRFEPPGGDAWRRLEALLRDLSDHHGFVGLVERWLEEEPSGAPTDRLLAAAKVAREELGDEERAAVFYFKVLEREPFNAEAFEGYKEHWRRKNNWSHLAELLLYQIDQAQQVSGPQSPLARPEFAENFAELAEVYERRLGDLGGALVAWNRLATAYPADWRPREQIARLDKRARMLDNMIVAQENELVRIHEPARRFEVMRRLTQAQRERMTDPQRTITLYHEMLALAPGDATTLKALAEMYERTGAYDQVIDLLRRQHDVTRSVSQRVVLLRRMAEIWQNELRQPRDALWACEQVLGYSQGDTEALHRMQSLCAELAEAAGEFDALARELQIVGEPAARIRALRRMVDVAERKLQDPQRTAQACHQLLAADPHNMEVLDKMIGVYEAIGRHEELANLLGKAAASAKTPPVRQLDYLMRLGNLAETTLGDHDLACSAFERVLRIHRDHRGAVEALTRIYRALGSWHGLAAALGNLQDMVDSDEEAIAIGWERSEVLADKLDNPAAAVRVLEALASGIAIGNRDVATRLLELYERAAQHDKLIRHAELLLLSCEDIAERRELYELIARGWLVHFQAQEKALASFHRFMAESPDDPDGLRIMGELQTLTGDHAGTLATLERRLEVSEDPAEQVVTLEQMAEVCEHGLGHAKRALQLLGRALGIAPGSRELKAKIEAFAETHRMWKDLLVVYAERFTEMGARGDARGQIEISLSASAAAEQRIGDVELSFAWAKKAYFVALRSGLDAAAVLDRLEGMAQKHSLWGQMLEVTEQELALQESSKSPSYGDYGTIALLLSASEIARERLLDPHRSLGFLQRAYRLRPDDEELARQIEATAEVNNLWPALIELHESRLARARTGLARFESCHAIAKVYERQLNSPEKAFTWLRRAWDELRAKDPSLAEEAMDLLVQLAERHGLWAQLAEHHRIVAGARASKNDPRSALASLVEAARIEHEKRGDLLAALRTLKQGVSHDPTTSLLPKIRELASTLDEQRAEGSPRVGALALLAALQQYVGAAVDPNAKINLLKQRAELREKQLGDAQGAMAEWLRVLQLHPGSDEARFELARLAERENLWHLVLLVPAWELAQKPGKKDQLRLLGQIADLYEQNLARPEYALRARIAAWRLNAASPADLPPRAPLQASAQAGARNLELGPQHSRLWKLAELVGNYDAAPPVRDPLLWPQLQPPELADQNLWHKLGLHPTTFAPLSARPSGDASDTTELPREHSGVVDLSDVEELDGARLTGEILLEPSELAALRKPREPSGLVDASDVEEIEELRLTGEIILEPHELAALRKPREHTGVVDASDVEELDDFEEARLTGEIILDPAELAALRKPREHTGVVDMDDIEEVEPRREQTNIVDLGELIDDADDDDDELLSTRPKPALPRPQPGANKPTQPPSRGRPGTTGKLTQATGPKGHGASAPAKPSKPATPAAPPAPSALSAAAAEAQRARVASVTAGLPQLPELSGPALASRPAAQSGWDELALAYATTPATSKPERAAVAAALARMWDEGAHQPEPALNHLEEALALTPDDLDLRARLEALAAREQRQDRLIDAYGRLLGELTVPEHIVGYGLRLADLYEKTGQLDRAEEQYQAVVSVAPRERDALRALARIHERSGRDREFVDASARLLDLEAPELDTDARVARTLALTHDLVTRVDRQVDATRRLEALARELPQHPQVHERLADLLVRQGLWNRAVEALKAAATSVPDPDFQLRALARVAAISEEQLAQVPQAIAAWQDIARRRLGDPEALAQLQRLYLKTEQYSLLLPIVDQRLARVGEHDRDSRIALLVVKARALQEGLGDEAAAMSTLETLAAEAPENDDVLLGLSRLVRRRGRLDEGLQLLRARLDAAVAASTNLSDETGTFDPAGEDMYPETAAPGFDPLPVDPFGPIPHTPGQPADPRSLAAARIVKIASAFADALEHEAHEPSSALAVVDEALATIPDLPATAAGRSTLVARKVALARAQNDPAALVDGLALLGLPDGLLEAATLARSKLGDPELAAQLYTRVLAIRIPGDPQQGKRLSAAIEGLVRLRIEAGDIDGADALMDAQLAELADTELRARILTEIGRTLLASSELAPTRSPEPSEATAEPTTTFDVSEPTTTFDATDAPEPTTTFDVTDAPEPTTTFDVTDAPEPTTTFDTNVVRPTPDDPETRPETRPETEAEVEEFADAEAIDDDDEPATLLPAAPRRPPPARPAPPARPELSSVTAVRSPDVTAVRRPDVTTVRRPEPATTVRGAPQGPRQDPRTATLQAARRRFEAALAADPDYAPARLSLGTVLFELGQLAEAEPVLEGVVEAFGLLRDQENLVGGLVLLARLFEQTDRSAEAYRRLSMALRHDPDNLEIRAAMARNRHAAGRWRDTLAAIDPIEQRLASGLELSPAQAELVSDLLLLAAECDIQLKQTERLAARYERAAALHPRGRKARAALAALCQESGRLAEAAEHTRALAELGDDPIEKGRTLLRAGMLFHEAAGAAAGAGDSDTSDETETGVGQALRTAAFECVQAGVALIADQPAPVLDRQQLEAAFWTAAPRHTGIALACLKRLLLHPDLKSTSRQAIVIEGSRIALQRGEPGDAERALALAKIAVETTPEAAASVHAVFDVLASEPERLPEIETVVLGFFNRVGRTRAPNPGEGLARQRLLTRLAVLERDRPDHAIRLLERAAELDPQSLDLASRRQLAQLYEAAAIEGPPVHVNDEALLVLDPLDERSLASVARRCVEQGERDRAHALYQVLRLISPQHPDAAAFLGKNDLQQVSNGKLDVNSVIDKPPAGGGVIAAMTQLWEGAAELICDELPKQDISAAAWIEADSDKDTLLWKVWTELGHQLSTQGIRLADADMIPGIEVGDGWTQVRAAHPPIIVVGPAARSAELAPRLRFVLGRALFGSRPASAPILGLSRQHSAAVLSAALQAFHPRHTRRTRVRDDADLATRLAQTFARKLPIRLARQLSALFKEHELEGFDSRDWRAWAHRSGQRVGLSLARNLGVALDILSLPQDPNDRAHALKTRTADDPDLRDLVVFATSPAFAAARKALGFEVRGR
ncbi:tetratricopeptide repeat protein [Nannocystis sp.]|uniref:tetratricopeptide repeat protein n=1 Tax=Nannocystis sp. TaxID=1962667 RepID=UPI0025E3EECE|nr:tetratricopeptide repeat protein [Nannocystis sp.]MBK7826249.1 tetratricopeptide repeat protein [Nannocystis sp.]